MNKKILFILPHSPSIGPSQRYRVGLFLPYLKESNFTYSTRSFFSENEEKVIYASKKLLKKSWIYLKNYIKRFYVILIESLRYDYIFIQRGSAPFGPPIFEWWMAKVYKKKLIYDFDDSIWLPQQNQKGRFVSWLKAAWKVKHICKWSHKVVVGNQYLLEFAKKYNSNVLIIPTCVDTKKNHNFLKLHRKGAPPIVGWTGSHSTLIYMEPLLPILRRTQVDLGFKIAIICNKNPKWEFIDYEFIEWSNKTEVKDLANFDVGIMPLTDDVWTRGKCGFKLVQYMSLGIPALASPVGVNVDIIDDGKNGFLCKSDIDWENDLKQLIGDAILRNEMGISAKQKIISCYSINSQLSKFIGLFE